MSPLQLKKSLEVGFIMTMMKSGCGSLCSFSVASSDVSSTTTPCPNPSTPSCASSARRPKLPSRSWVRSHDSRVHVDRSVISGDPTAERAHKRRDVSIRGRGVFRLAETVPQTWQGSGEEGEVLKVRL